MQCETTTTDRCQSNCMIKMLLFAMHQERINMCLSMVKIIVRPNHDRELINTVQNGGCPKGYGSIFCFILGWAKRYRSISLFLWDKQKDIERYLFWYGINKKISNDIFFGMGRSKRYRTISFCLFHRKKDIERYLVWSSILHCKINFRQVVDMFVKPISHQFWQL